MLNRRELLGHGAIASILSGIPAGLARSFEPDFRPDLAVVDRKLADAPVMAARLGREALSLHLFAGDPGRLWMNVIEPALRSRPVRLAGFTSAPTLFCLQYLARDYGLELAAQAAGPVAPDRIVVGRSELLDLRDARFVGPETTITWVLAPKGG
jgi:hypothetical protein